MTLTIQETDDKLFGTLCGRLDTAAAAQFEQDIEPLKQNADKLIVLDLSQLEFISSSGLRHLLSLRKATMTLGGNVTLKHVSNDIMQVFTLTGFNNLFTFE